MYQLDVLELELGSSDVASEAVDLSYFTHVSIQVVWADADETDAALQFEVSNDGVNWLKDTTSAPDVSIGAASGTGGWDWPRDFNWRYVRIYYDAGTNTTGTAKLYVMSRR